MNLAAKIVIVAALAVTVGLVILAKRSPGPSAQPSADAMSTMPTTTVAASGCCAAVGAATLPATAPPTTTAAVAANLPRLVDLGAGKCIPCKKMAPILDELKVSLAGKLRVEFVDVWVNPDAGQKYGIEIIPTQIFYDASGRELSRHQGFMSRDDILARFREHGIELQAN